MTELGACWLPKDLHLISQERNISQRLDIPNKTTSYEGLSTLATGEDVGMKKFSCLTCLQGIPR